MKYRYLKKGQKLSSSDIKAHMNFEQVLQNASTSIEQPLSETLTHKSASKSWLLLLLLLPIAVGAYFTLNTAGNNDYPNSIQPKETQAEAEPSPAKPALADSIQPEQEIEAKTDSAKEKTAIKEEKPQAEETPRPIKKTESFDKEVVKEDVFIKASPKMGFEKFYEFIDQELQYPENANSNIFEGYVKVLFAINPDGTISDFQIQESLGEAFDNEALRVLKLVKDWEPATFNSEAVRSQLSIKLKFDLEDH